MTQIPGGRLLLAETGFFPSRVQTLGIARLRAFLFAGCGNSGRGALDGSGRLRYT